MSRLPSPAEYGLPEQFDSWRPCQEDALHKLETSTKRVKALSLPTGSGKSLIAVVHALRSGKPTCIVTDTIGLQDQYVSLFSEIGVADIRGRRNYQCRMRADYSCEQGRAAKCMYVGSVACPYSQAEIRAALAPIVITNYAKWTAARKYGPGMSHFEQVIFDEAHHAPAALANAMQVVLHHREIEDILKIPFLDGPEAKEFGEWKRWAMGAKAVADVLVKAARERLRDSHPPKPSWVKHYLHMQQLAKRLATLSTASVKDWIVDTTKDGYQFDPIRPGRYAEVALLCNIPSIIFISATLRPKTLFMTGVGRQQFDFWEFPSEFDAARCPIYYIPTMRVDHRAPSMAPLWARLDQIAARRRDRKGIVHTISYARRDEVVEASRFSDSMIINQQGEVPSGMIETFRQSPPGTILVSPSVGEGYDFKGRQAEWQMVCKIPFPDGRSQIVKARSADDREYAPYQAMQSLVQTCGRVMRDKSDQGETFLPDEHLEWFLPRYLHLAPKSFRQFLKKVEVLPPPPPPL